MTASRVCTAVGLAITVGPVVWAHHSDVAFDMEAIIALEGTITEFSWRNPHVYLELEVEDADGETAEWQIQSHPTMVLTRSGWTRDSLEVGDVVTLRGHPDQNPQRLQAILVSAETPGGTLLGVNDDRESESSAVATDLNGRWKITVESFEKMIEDFQAVPPTESALAAIAEYDIYADEALKACSPMPAPAAFPLTIALYVGEIEIGEDQVYFRSEYYDTERVVYLDGREHPDDSERMLHGHSIGRWEDDVLVVDTTNFSYQRASLQNGIPASEQKYLVERYDLSDDGTSLMIQIMLEDLEYFSAPVNLTVEAKYTPEAQMFRYDCRPEVSGQFAF